MDLGIFCFLLLTSVNAQELDFIDDQQNYDGWIRGSPLIKSHCEVGKRTTNILKHGHHYDENCRCHTYGDYYDTYSFLTCNNFALTTYESLNIYPKENIFKYITFQNSAISVVPVGAFMVFTNITELYLNNTSVESIHPGAFTGLINLHELYLQNNNISEISKGMFNSLPKLEILDLSKNILHHIEENTFLGLFSIESLYLGNNKLRYLQKHTFQKLHSLNLVDLSNNLFSNVSEDVFEDTIEITDLDLSFNNLTNFAFSISFFGMERLNLSHNNINNLTFEFYDLGSIDLSYNNLLKIENLPQSLKQLNLSNNKIKMINHSLFNKSLMLNTINLADNLISYLNDETFSNLSQLMYLHLQNNNLSNIPIDCFKDLNFLLMLNLSGNHIDELEYGTFAGLDNLKSLDISNNRLPYLYESSFHNLKHLQNLNIGNNLITSFDPHDLLEYSTALSTVSIDNNPWNCKSLLNIVHEFEKRRVEVLRGSAAKSEHVRGIACSNNKIDNNYFANVKENHSLEHFYKLSTELNSLIEFFDKDFLNSSFYRFFESFREINKVDSFNTTNGELLKFLNITFNNTAFHNLLDRNSSIPSGFYSLEKAISKLSMELNLINTNIRNLSSSKSNLDSPNVTHYFSTYFENDFKNSSFYKYFHKDFDNSKLVKYFESTFPNQFDIGLSKIRNYFDTDFRNSSFYQLFSNFYWNEPDSKISESQAHFSGLTSNSNFLDNNELLNKLSELSNNLKLQQDIMQSAKAGTTVFMTIIIILLLTITFLFVFNYVKNGFKKTISRVSYETTEHSRINIANAEMELI